MVKKRKHARKIHTADEGIPYHTIFHSSSVSQFMPRKLHKGRAVVNFLKHMRVSLRNSTRSMAGATYNMADNSESLKIPRPWPACVGPTHSYSCLFQTFHWYREARLNQLTGTCRLVTFESCHRGNWHVVVHHRSLYGHVVEVDVQI